MVVLRHLLSFWRLCDRLIVRLTAVLLYFTGGTMFVFLLLSVLGRYVVDFSFMFVEAGASFLVVWFFMLGAGLALREKGHVGFELLRSTVPDRLRRVLELAADLLVLGFVGLLLAGSPGALEVAAAHEEPMLGISSAWATLAVPAGALLLIYHQVCVMAERHLGLVLRPEAGSSAAEAASC